MDVDVSVVVDTVVVVVPVMDVDVSVVLDTVVVVSVVVVVVVEASQSVPDQRSGWSQAQVYDAP